MGTVNSKILALLHNYPFGAVTNQSGTPTPFFIFLPVSNYTTEIAKPGVSATPLVGQSPYVLDLGFSRTNITLNMASPLVLNRDRETYDVVSGGNLRTYTEYSATELEEIFTIMRYSRQRTGNRWQFLIYGDTNRISHNTLEPQLFARTYNCALLTSNFRYDPPGEAAELVATFVVESIANLNFNPIQ